MESEAVESQQEEAEEAEFEKKQGPRESEFALRISNELNHAVMETCIDFSNDDRERFRDSKPDHTTSSGPKKRTIPASKVRKQPKQSKEDIGKNERARQRPREHTTVSGSTRPQRRRKPLAPLIDMVKHALPSLLVRLSLCRPTEDSCQRRNCVPGISSIHQLGADSS